MVGTIPRWGLFLVIALAVPLVGCKPQARAKPTNLVSRVGTSNTGTTATTSELLSSGIDVMVNSRAELDEYRSAINQIEEYLTRKYPRRSDAFPALSAIAAQQIAESFGGAAVVDARRPTFDPLRDAEYFRTVFFCQRVVRAVTEGLRDDLARAEALWRWTIRQVQLAPADSLPVGTPALVAIRGQGSPEERAWLFLELCRQAGLPGAMVGLPDPKQPETKLPWLVAVEAAGAIVLFDPVLGLPLPGAAPDTLLSLPDLAGKPAWWTTFLVDPNRGYPFPVTKLDGLVLMPYALPAMFAPRMAYLESNLAGATRAVLTADIVKTRERWTAALVGVPNQGGIAVWSFPSTTLATVLGDPQRSFAINMQREILSARLDQLYGDHRSTINQLVALDEQWTTEVLNTRFRETYQDGTIRQRVVAKTRQDIMYFMALSQLALAEDNPRIAADWFNRYLTQYGDTRLADDNLLSFGDLCEKLAVNGVKSEPNPARTLYTRLPQPIKDLVGKYAKDNFRVRILRQEIQFQEGLLAKTRVDLRGVDEDDPIRKETEARILVVLGDRRAQLNALVADEPFDRPRLMTALNEQLAKPEFWVKDDFARLLEAEPAESPLAQLVSTTKPLSPAEIALRNRLLLDAAFPEALSRQQNSWVPNVIVELATCEKRLGRVADGLNRLKTGHSNLAPIHQTANLTLAKLWSLEGKKAP